MQGKSSYLLALVLVCGVGRAGEPIPDDARFVGHTRKATVELVGVTIPTKCEITVVAAGWHFRRDWPAPKAGTERRRREINWGTREERFLPKHKFDNSFHAGRGRKVVTFLIRVWNPSTEQSSYGDDRYDRSTADTSRSANDLPIERPSDGQYRHDDSANDVLPLVFGFKPWGPSPEVDYVAGVRTGVTTQRKNIFAPESGSDAVVDADGNVVPNYTMFSAVVAEPAQTAVFRVGVSREAWETVASQQPDRAGSSRFDRYGCDWTVVFDKAESRGASDGTQVKLKTTLSGYEAFNVVTQRLVAVTSDGNEHATKWGEGDWKRGRTIIYDLPLSSIKEFRFQVSPYEWVEFGNVSLTARSEDASDGYSVGQCGSEKSRALRSPTATGGSLCGSRPEDESVRAVGRANPAGELHRSAV